MYEVWYKNVKTAEQQVFFGHSWKEIDKRAEAVLGDMNDWIVWTSDYID